MNLGQTFNQIEQKRVRLLQKLSNDDTSKFQQTLEKGWSVVQVLNHLIASERGSLAYCRKKMLATDLQKVSRLQILRMDAFNLFQRLPIRLKAPQFLNEPDNSQSFEEVCKNWDESRQELLQFITEIPSDYRSKSIYKHPFAGRVDLTRMLHFFAAHQRHHEHQLRRILTRLKK